MASPDELNKIVSKLEEVRDAARGLDMPHAVLGIEQAIFACRWEIREIIEPPKKNVCQARVYGGKFQCSKRASKGDYCGMHAKIHK